MNEISYNIALESGIEPIHYRADVLSELDSGSHSGTLDALVWSRRQPCLMALITLDNGVKVQVVGFQKHSRKELPEYLGLRLLAPGSRVLLSVDVGIRGGLRPSVVQEPPKAEVGAREDCGSIHAADQYPL